MSDAINLKASSCKDFYLVPQSRCPSKLLHGVVKLKKACTAAAGHPEANRKQSEPETPVSVFFLHGTALGDVRVSPTFVLDPNVTGVNRL